ELGRGARVYDGARLDLKGGSIRIGEGSMIYGNAMLKSDGELLVGKRMRVGYGACLHSSERVEIGGDVALGEYVSIIDSDHAADGTDTPILSRPIVTDPVVIEANVLLARGAVVLRGARIGKNSVIAANSVVRGGEYP